MFQTNSEDDVDKRKGRKMKKKGRKVKNWIPMKNPIDLNQKLKGEDPRRKRLSSSRKQKTINNVQCLAVQLRLKLKSLRIPSIFLCSTTS